MKWTDAAVGVLYGLPFGLVSGNYLAWLLSHEGVPWFMWAGVAVAIAAGGAVAVAMDRATHR